jgi:hypothetical protein
MSNLYKLVYTSSRRPDCGDAEIEKILASCRVNNPKKNITGILLHSKYRFLQYIEGDKDEIMRLFNFVKKDDRHGGVNLRYFSPINERVFPSWQMGYKDVNLKSTVFQTSINQDDKAIFQKLIEDQDQSEVEGIRVLKMFFEMA